MKGKLVILIGPPAAGKSTWLYQFSGEVISTDDIRRREFGVQYDQQLEPAVWQLAYERLEEYIRSGKDVCFDATNTTRGRRKPLIELAKKIRSLCGRCGFPSGAGCLNQAQQKPPSWEEGSRGSDQRQTSGTGDALL
jgi:predicted kinase